MEELTARLVGSLVGVGTERISLSLDEIRREASGSKGVVERECGRVRGDRDSCSDRSADRPAPSRLGLCHGIAEKPLEEEIREVAADLERLGVRKIGPSHCSGDTAKQIFREKWGENFLSFDLGDTYSL